MRLHRRYPVSLNGKDVFEFEIKSTDLGARIGSVRTKSGGFETPALLPVIHPVNQLVPCKEIRSMRYEAVMTNAFTVFKRLKESAQRGIHRIIDFDGPVMTDSGGYQVLEFGDINIVPEEMARFEEELGSDIAIVLDQPTGLNVSRSRASETVGQTIGAARRTKKCLSRQDIAWMLPIQGGKYLDLVSKSSKQSRVLEFDGYALGSPVEVMEEYDFVLLVQMILASKNHMRADRVFHLFGAGHPFVIPLAISLGCDTFDSASYILYAKQDRYIWLSGTVRLRQLEYLPCSCRTCTSMTAREMKSLAPTERTAALARHNLNVLKQQIEETKLAIWEGRLWEYLQTNCRNHPRLFEALSLATKKGRALFDYGTPAFKERGLFLFESLDTNRPEIRRLKEKLAAFRKVKKTTLVILPETRTKPFLCSDLYREVSSIVSLEKTLVTFLSSDFGLVPSEISDIFPCSQITSSVKAELNADVIFNCKNWDYVFGLFPRNRGESRDWLSRQPIFPKLAKEKRILVATNYKSFKQRLKSSID